MKNIHKLLLLRNNNFKCNTKQILQKYNTYSTFLARIQKKYFGNNCMPPLQQSRAP